MRKISKYIFGIGGLAVAGLGVYVGLSKESAKYSLEWIKKLTDKEWEIARENIRQKFLCLENTKRNMGTKGWDYLWYGFLELF